MIEGYRGIKNRNYCELDEGQIDFGIRDQKGRAIGYHWRIHAVTTEVMSDAEYAAQRFCQLVGDGEPLDYVELRSFDNARRHQLRTEHSEGEGRHAGRGAAGRCTTRRCRPQIQRQKVCSVQRRTTTMSWQKQRDMTPGQYKHAIKMLGMTQAGSGRFLGVSERTAHRYVSGDAVVPDSTALLLRSMIYHGEEPEVPEWTG